MFGEKMQQGHMEMTWKWPSVETGS